MDWSERILPYKANDIVFNSKDPKEIMIMR